MLLTGGGDGPVQSELWYYLCIVLTGGGDGPVRSELYYHYLHNIDWRRGRSRPVCAQYCLEAGTVPSRLSSINYYTAGKLKPCAMGGLTKVPRYVNYVSHSCSMLVTYAFNVRNPWVPTECVSMHSPHHIYSLQVWSRCTEMTMEVWDPFLSIKPKWELLFIIITIIITII